MNLVESLRTALMALRTNKMRALLTMLGIIIGVSTVIGMLAIGNGYARFIRSEFNKMGVGIIYVYPRVDTQDADSTLQPRLTAADAEAIMLPGTAPAVADVVVEYEGGDRIVSAGRDRYFYPVKGLTPNYFAVSENDLGAGRYYSDEENRNSARVVVVGERVATTLFGTSAGAVGQRMMINGVSFEIVGVLTTKANQMSAAMGSFADPREVLYIPYQTARSRLFRNQLNSRVDVSRLTVKIRNESDATAAIDQVTAVLRQQHRLTYQNNDFSIVSPEQILEQFNATLIGFNAFLGTIAGISLLVGGIGIMNIMLVSVTQRTREIGLRKAVGARRRDIMAQFLIEAIVLCLIGGAIGIAIGFSLSFVGTFVLEGVLRLSGARAEVSANSVLLVTLVSATVGISFGFFPALRAARMHPIQALRQE